LGKACDPSRYRKRGEAADPWDSARYLGVAQRVFVVGFRRSGTTLLQSLLGAHRRWRRRPSCSSSCAWRTSPTTSVTWAEKTPLQRADGIYDLFPDALIVHIMRDARYRGVRALMQSAADGVGAAAR
jgi:hypothetical protein